MSWLHEWDLRLQLFPDPAETETLMQWSTSRIASRWSPVCVLRVQSSKSVTKQPTIKVLCFFFFFFFFFADCMLSHAVLMHFSVRHLRLNKTFWCSFLTVPHPSHAQIATVTEGKQAGSVLIFIGLASSLQMFGLMNSVTRLLLTVYACTRQTLPWMLQCSALPDTTTEQKGDWHKDVSQFWS